MTITIKDVARHAGVGVGTVSRVLNNSEAVKSTTRERVLAAISELEYVPNEHARRLSTGKTLNIGVIAPFFTSHSVVERLRGIELVIAGTTYDLIMFNIDSVAKLNHKIQDLTQKRAVDGLIIISMKSSLFNTTRLKTLKIPTVIIDAESLDFPNVVIDDVTGGYIATKHLINLGHRQIAFLSDIFDSELGNNSSEDRFKGYKLALQEAGIPFNPYLTRHQDFTREAGCQMAKDLFASSSRVTAIFTTSDMLAAGVIKAARELNLTVPGEISLIGYDDIELAEYMNLTTIRQPLFESGRRGANLLLEQLTSKRSDLAVDSAALPIELVIRGTTEPLSPC